MHLIIQLLLSVISWSHIYIYHHTYLNLQLHSSQLKTYYFVQDTYKICFTINCFLKDYFNWFYPHATGTVVHSVIFLIFFYCLYSNLYAESPNFDVFYIFWYNPFFYKYYNINKASNSPPLFWLLYIMKFHLPRFGSRFLRGMSLSHRNSRGRRFLVYFSVYSTR